MTSKDAYWMDLARKTASASKCRSRQCGAVLVLDGVLISSGYNGPPRGYPHCTECPRRAQGYASGERLDLCPAAHAEANAIAQAARSGVSVKGSTMYLVGGVPPCKQCAGSIVNAGISEVIAESDHEYDQFSAEILRRGGVSARTYLSYSRHIGGLGEK